MDLGTLACHAVWALAVLGSVHSVMGAWRVGKCADRDIALARIAQDTDLALLAKGHTPHRAQGSVALVGEPRSPGL